jgi:hypothetical protein
VDLKQYFRKIREIEAGIDDAFVLVTSLETTDGGRAGIVSEVPRNLAAKMIAEGCAAIATKAERDAYVERQEAGRIAAQKAEVAKRLQVTIVPDGDVARISGPGQSGQKSKN